MQLSGQTCPKPSDLYTVLNLNAALGPEPGTMELNPTGPGICRGASPQCMLPLSNLPAVREAITRGSLLGSWPSNNFSAFGASKGYLTQFLPVAESPIDHAARRRSSQVKNCLSFPRESNAFDGLETAHAHVHTHKARRLSPWRNGRLQVGTSSTSAGRCDSGHIGNTAATLNAATSFRGVRSTKFAMKNRSLCLNPSCSRTFGRYADMIRHTKTTTCFGRPLIGFVCDWCPNGKVMTRRDSYMRHRRTCLYQPTEIWTQNWPGRSRRRMRKN